MTPESKQRATCSASAVGCVLWVGMFALMVWVVSWAWALIEGAR